MVSSPRSAPRKRQPLQRSRQPSAPPSIWRRMLSWVARSEDDGRPPEEQQYEEQPEPGEVKRKVKVDVTMEDLANGQPPSKRARRLSPVPEKTVVNGWNDVPHNMLRAPPRATQSMGGLERTMSVDPKLVPLPVSRDASMDLSPRPLRIRSTLTPSRSALDFGPRPHRDRSEPLNIASLRQNPVFVRPPPQQNNNDTRRVSDSDTPNTTLGALASQRAASIPRAHSSLNLGNAPAPPLTKAQLALQTLDLYKTPIVPARLRNANGSAPSPVPLIEPMFQSRSKTRGLVLTPDDRPRKPRLGTAHRVLADQISPQISTESKKEKGKRDAKAKPYAGSGSVRKLLSKRKAEEKEIRKAEEEEKKAQVIEEEEHFAVPHKRESRIPAPPRVTAPGLGRKVSAPTGPHTRSSSVGLARRPAPTAGRTVGPTRRRRGHFSAAEEDDDDATLVASPTHGLTDIREEKEKEKETPTPAFELPQGFSFAPPPEVQSITPALAESVKDAPVSSLPFSLTPTPKPTESTGFSFGAPAAKPAEETPKLGTGFSFGAPAAAAPAPVPAPEAPKPAAAFSFGAAPAAAPAPAPAAEASKPSFSSFSFAELPAASIESKKDEAPKPPAPIAFSFGQPSAEKKDEAPKAAAPAAAPFSFGPPAAEKKDEAAKPATPAPFSFGQPAAPAEKKDEALKPVAPAPFSFGQPAEKKVEAPKPAASPALFSFGAAPATPDTATEKKSGFNFGAPAATSSTTAAPAAFSFGAPATPVAENKSTGFTFGAPAAAQPARPVTPPNSKDDGMRMEESPVRDPVPKLSVQTPGGSGFSFGTPAAGASSPFPQPATNGGFSFGTPTKAAGTGFSFGAPKPAENSGGFSFGASKPAEPAANGGTGFSFGANKAPASAPAAPAPFSFGAAKPADGSASAGGFGSNAGSGFSFGAAKPAENANTGFSFGANSGTTNNTSGGFGSGSGGFGASNNASAGGFGSNAGPGFSFGGPKSATDAPTNNAFNFGTAAGTDSRPSSSGGFAFGAPAQQATPSSSPFAFGSQPLPSAGGFGATGTAPSSPAVGFGGGFGSQPQTQGGGFTFGASQPSSPAVTTGAFSFGGGGVTPSTPTAGGGGGAMFSMGAAPTQAAGGARQVRPMPKRRAATGKR